jgi:hypothetical protein
LVFGITGGFKRRGGKSREAPRVTLLVFATERGRAAADSLCAGSNCTVSGLLLISTVGGAYGASRKNRITSRAWMISVSSNGTGRRRSEMLLLLEKLLLGEEAIVDFLKGQAPRFQ